MFQKELYNFERVNKFIEDIHNVLNCRKVPKHSKFDARSTVVPNTATATASAPAVEIWTCSNSSSFHN
jgi:hypothetical protein